MKELGFDVVIHLAGEQAVPNYMAVKLCEAGCHVLLTTTRTKSQYEKLVRMFPERHNFIRHLEVPSTNYAEIKQKIEECCDSISAMSIGVNITGGTKPMSTAALDVCRNRGYTPFYFDTQERKIHFFTADYTVIEMPPVFETVEEFVRLSGYEVVANGRCLEDISEEERELAKVFWKNKDFVRRAIGDFSSATDKRFQNQKDNPPACYQEALRVLRGRQDKRGKELLSAWERCYPPKSSDWRRAARFGAGEWFEVWSLLQFGESRSRDGFLDLRTGMSISFSDMTQSAQEVDLIYTDGYVLSIVECKAGQVKQEHVQKLENIRRQIGGVMGRGILCAINYQYEDEIVCQRVKNGTISLVTGDEALRMLPTRSSLVRPGRCYQERFDYDA